MKKHLFSIGFLLAVWLSTPFMVHRAWAATTSVQSVQDDRTNTIITANLLKARVNIEKGDYVAAQKNINRVFELAPGNTEAQQLKRHIEEGLNRQLQHERDAFEKACNTKTTDALHNFIETYPNSLYVAAAQARIDDYNLWQNTTASGLLADYDHYLKSSTVLGYKEDAERAIRQIHAENDWNTIRETTDLGQIETYLRQYPEVVKDHEARFLWNALKAEKIYSGSTQRLAALDYYREAQSIGNLSTEQIGHMQQLVELQAYEQIKNSDDENTLKEFLTTYPHSEYSRLVNNRLSSVRTRHAKELKAYRHLVHMQAHRQWWHRNLHFGWHMGMDFGEEYFFSYRTGIRMKLGTHQDVFNICLGLDYVNQTMFLKENYNGNITDHPLGHQAAVPLDIKFNFTNGDNKCSFYVGIGSEYAYRFAQGQKFSGSICQHAISYEPKVGLNGKNADLCFFYKGYLTHYPLYNIHYDIRNKLNHKGGFSLTIYF